MGVLGKEDVMFPAGYRGGDCELVDPVAKLSWKI